MSRVKGPLFLFLAFSLAGSSVVSARFVSGKLGLFTIAAVSLLLALLFLITMCGRALIDSLRGFTAAKFRPLALQALMGIFLFRMFLLTGLNHTSSVEAGILTGATPAITALLSRLILKEAPDWKKRVGILCSVGGVLLIQGLMEGGTDFTGGHLLGNLLVLCAAGCESGFNILSRITAVQEKSNGQKPLGPLVQTTLVTAIALGYCLLPALFEHPLERLGALGIREWLALFWYGLFVTALGFVFWYAGIKRCGGFTAAAFSGLMPFVSLLLSVWVLGEQAGWRQWLGGLMVVLGMALIATGGTHTKLPLRAAKEGVLFK